MEDKDIKLVKALIKGTEEKKIEWELVPFMNYSQFSEKQEFVEGAYYFVDVNYSRRIVIYKANTTFIDGFGEETEKTNIHLFFSETPLFKVSFKLSDYDLNRGGSAFLWSLYKLAQRSQSNADQLIDGLIKEYGSKEDDFPF
ncbi:hypothetical protein PQ456_11460 [Paenibacillus kyungheensis]|uniref:Uncharacterized protein n=1 Tax=Paenibacillus kyungheensis TaxID=1452732 RepID=A0AAX3LVC9_9BACL|nr:hypothetical protein [Paenibacillus kyungheensis]WCT53831.1 hypothetical protein PQ456_11460 [Paenibacillus kyungheensis]